MALDLDSGLHEARNLTMDATVASGADVAAGATLNLRDSRLVGLTGTAVALGGTATLETVLIGGAAQGIVLASTGNLTLRHSTVAGGAGAGVNNAAGGTVVTSFAILSDNAGGDLIGVPCASVLCSDVESVDCSGVNANLWVDPLLDAGFRPQDSSLVLDHCPNPATFAGSPCHDLDEGPRLRDFDGDGLSRLDPGAFERENAVLTPGPVANLRWTGHVTLQWDAVVGAGEYHVYRATIASLGYGNFGTCRDDLDADRTDTVLTDFEAPASGAGFAYAISAEGGAGVEGSLGLASCAERSNFTPCP